MTGSYAVLSNGQTMWSAGGGEIFYDFPSAVASATWTMTIQEAGQTSVYKLAPDFSAVDPNQFVLAQVPPATFSDSAPPTLTWSRPAGEVAGDGYVTMYSITDFTTSITAPISSSTSSWTAPASLPDGTYVFDVEYSGLSMDVPLNASLVSGPGIDMPSTATFNFSSNVATQFVVVPEPASAAMFLASGLFLASRRRRN